MATTQVVDIPFPVKGYHENAAYRQQPEGTTPDCLNVRPFGLDGTRLRGGQRAGLSKYLADAVDGSNAIQSMGQVTQALDPDSIVADTQQFASTFTQSDGLIPAANWWLHESGDLINQGDGTPATTVDSTDGPKVKSNVVDSTEHPNSNTHAGWLKDVLDPGSVYILKARVKFGDANNVTHIVSVGFFFRGDDPSGSMGQREYMYAGTYSTNSVDKLIIFWGANNSEYDQAVITGIDHSVWHDLELHVNGNVIQLYLNGVLKINITKSRISSQTRIGFGISDDNEAVGAQLDDFELWTGVPPASLRTTQLVAVSGGDIYAGTVTGGLAQPASGDGAVKNTGFVDIQEAYGKAYFCDGIFNDYKIFDPPTFAVTAWTPSAGQLPGGGSGTSYPITAVDIGAGTFTATGISAAVVPNDIIEVHSSTGNNKTYKVTVDDAADTITVQETIPDATVDGSIRVVDVSCKYSTLYRGRIVMWGLYTDPQNWFMSAVGNPLDWDYSPANLSATMAVAGNNSDAGLIGDVLNCCAPYSDDLMIMGGDHTLWIMRGDPAAGGSIDNISYQTGIVGPEAYAWNPDGEFFFFGAGALWKMESASVAPMPLSRGKLDTTFGNFNFATHTVRLLWDNLAHGLHIFLVPPVDQPSTVPTHYFWDARTESFWIDEFPVAHGPSAIATFDSDDPDDRAFLLGGWDSYIRQLDTSAKNDDGTKMTSFILYPPMVPYGNLVNAKLLSLQVNMAVNTNPVRLEIYSAATAEDVVAETTPRVARTLRAASRQPPIRQRVSDPAIMIKLIQDNTDNSYSWAIESMNGAFQPGGLVRKY